MIFFSLPESVVTIKKMYFDKKFVFYCLNNFRAQNSVLSQGTVIIRYATVDTWCFINYKRSELCISLKPLYLIFLLCSSLRFEKILWFLYDYKCFGITSHSLKCCKNGFMKVNIWEGNIVFLIRYLLHFNIKISIAIGI